MNTMNNVAKNIKNLRTKKGMTQGDLAEKLDISRAAVAQWETGRSTPDLSTLLALVAILGIESVEELVGYSVKKPEGQPPIEQYRRGPMVQLPVYEEISAGNGCFMRETPIDYTSVDITRVAHDIENYYLVRVKGDSMIGAGIMPGGLVLVHAQTEVESGQIALVTLPDGSTVVKRVRKFDDHVLLIPANPTREEQLFRWEDVTICGRVVQAITDLD